MSSQNGYNQQPNAEDPDALRYAYRDIRYPVNPNDQRNSEHRVEFLWPHQRPYSTLVVGMGAHWKPGCWQRVVDMVHFTNNYGYPANLKEVMDRCFQPYDALGAMRNEGIMMARQGYEYILYVDNDIMPAPDALIRMINRDQAITAPYIEEPGTGKPLHGPIKSKFSGLQAARWSVLSMLLFRVSVFNAFPGGEFWNNAVGSDEGYHFQKLWDVGHRPYIDTDILLPVYQKPTYPLATNRMTEADATSFWDERKEKLLAPPDRGPIDPNDYRQQDGVYLPFLDNREQSNGHHPEKSLVSLGGVRSISI